MQTLLTKVKALLALVKAFFSTPLFNTGRSMLYVTASAVLTSLVAQDKLSSNVAAVWTALAAAVLSPALASIFAPDGWRTWLFRVLAPAQGLLVYFGSSNSVWVVLAAAVVSSWLSTGFAAANVHNALPAARVRTAA